MTQPDAPTPVSDPAVRSLVRMIGLMAIICVCALGYLMVQKSNAAREHSVYCTTAWSRSYGHLPPDCR